MSMDSEGSITRWQTLADEQIADCRVFTVHRAQRRSEASGRESSFFYIGSRDWVNVVAITEAGELLLIRQYRHGTDEVTLEIPSGIIDEGESPEQAARRELLEETGFTCGDIVEIGRVRPNPAIMTNRAYTFLATGLTTAGSQALDEHEEIEVQCVPLASLDTLVRTGAINHSLMIAAFHFFSLYRQTIPNPDATAH